MTEQLIDARIRIMHCADLHLGRRLSALGALAEERRNERLQSFFSLLRHCEVAQVDLLLIAGDFIEAGDITPSAMQSIIDALAQLTHTRVFISPGNHDPYTIDSVYARYDWPERVTIFRGRMRAIELPELHVRIFGTGFTSSYQREPLFHPEEIPMRSAEANWIHIGLTHGELVSPDGHSDYNPIALRRIPTDRLDYLALGHIHLRTVVLREGAMRYAYCGTHDGGGFDEIGEQGVYFGTVGIGGVQLDFLPFSSRRFEEATLDISGVSTLSEVRGHIEAFFDGRGQGLGSDYVRLTLIGQVDPQLRLSSRYLSTQLCRYAHELHIIDRTQPDWDVEALAETKNLRGYFVRAMMSRQAETADTDMHSILTEALRLGLCAFDGEVMQDEN